MSNIASSIKVSHSSSGAVFKANPSRTANESGFALKVYNIGTVDETIDVSEYNTVRHILLRLMSGDDVLVGLDFGTDGLNYPFRLSGDDDYMAIRLDIESLKEIQTVQTVADVADSLDGTYFVVEDANGETWAIGVGTLSHAEVNEVATGLLTGQTAAQVAAAIYSALAANAAFLALFDVSYDATADDDLITITDKHVGVRTTIADTGATGFTVASIQSGAAQPAIHVKSAGSSEICAGVEPN